MSLWLEQLHWESRSLSFNEINAGGTETVYSSETRGIERIMSITWKDLLTTKAITTYTYMQNTPNNYTHIYMKNTPNTKRRHVQTAPG